MKRWIILSLDFNVVCDIDSEKEPALCLLSFINLLYLCFQHAAEQPDQLY